MSQAFITSAGGSMELVITNFQLPTSSQMSSAVLRTRKVHYPVRAVQGSFTFTCQFNSVAQADYFRYLIRQHHKNALSSQIPTVRIQWAARGIDFQGFIKSVSNGEKFGDHAPSITVSMDTVRDNINHVVFGNDPNVTWQDVVTKLRDPAPRPDQATDYELPYTSKNDEIIKPKEGRDYF